MFGRWLSNSIQKLLKFTSIYHKQFKVEYVPKLTSLKHDYYDILSNFSGTHEINIRFAIKVLIFVVVFGIGTLAEARGSCIRLSS